MTVDDLTPMRESILKEIGSIGTAHAATALAKMTDVPIEVLPTRMQMAPLSEILGLFIGTEELQVGIYRRLREGCNGVVTFCIPKRDSYGLVDLLRKDPPGTAQMLGEAEQSALRESGGIICAAYVNTIAAMTGTTIRMTVPKLVFDQRGQVLQAILEGAFPPQTTAIVVENDFRSADRSLTGYFLFVPEAASLARLIELMETIIR